MYCLETRSLSHRFSKTEKILHDVNLNVLTGSIYGFLGPNGAGKTSTLKLVTGLLKKQQGEVVIFGKAFEKHRVAILRKIGALIESPSLFSQLTAVENLRVFQKIYRCPVSRIHAVLEMVGLAGTGNKKAGQFSLGMKQRLAIAAALLNEPELLILDEPTNGLDPNGILEMRMLLKRLNRENGITIIISSHLLSEIEKLATHVGVIRKGEIIFQDTLERLMNLQRLNGSLLLDTSNNVQARALIGALGHVAEQDETKLRIHQLTKENIGVLVKQLVENNITVFELSAIKNDLESVFMDLTK